MSLFIFSLSFPSLVIILSLFIYELLFCCYLFFLFLPLSLVVSSSFCFFFFLLFLSRAPESLALSLSLSEKRAGALGGKERAEFVRWLSDMEARQGGGDPLASGGATKSGDGITSAAQVQTR